MIEVEDYLIKSREERRSHLDLSSPCSEIGGNSTNFRALLCYHVGVKMPSKHQAYLCHACNNGKCSNVHHLYWGTPRDNVIDMRLAGNGDIHQNMIAKYGEERARQIRYHATQKSAIAIRDRAQKRIEEFRPFFEGEDLSTRGWAGRVAIKIGRTPSNVHQIAKRLGFK